GRMPDAVALGRDRIEVAAGQHALGMGIDDLRSAARPRSAVAALDQQPVVLGVTLAGATAEPNERPAPAQLLAVKREVEFALREAAGRVALGDPMPPVPYEDRARAVFPLRDHALERRVLERMILGLDGEPPFLRIEARAFRHRPAL